MTVAPVAAAHRLRGWVTQETVSGSLLLLAALAGLVWANSAARGSYRALVDWQVGPSALGLHLTLDDWAAEGLLAVFFFVVGLELKHELCAGSLTNVREAAVPVLAAVGGMVVPAFVYLGVALGTSSPTGPAGWPIPTATDIAFALAVLAVAGRGLPPALRLFLLTLAVVDDLLAIIVIAVFHTSAIHVGALVGSLLCVALFRVVATRRSAPLWLLLGPGLLAWWLMHESGVHATIAGVLLGLVVPASVLYAESRPRTVAWEHAVRPLSSAIALPIFAFLAAGVSVVDTDLGEILASPISLGTLGGLLLGKVTGVMLVTATLTRLTALRLPQGVGMRDLLGVGLLTGIGFTVSLLMAELSFPHDEHDLASAKVAVLLGSATAALLGATRLLWAGRRQRRDAVTQSLGQPPATSPPPDRP